MIDELKSIFSNREIASFLWFLILFIPFIFAQKKIRHSMKSLLVAIFDSKIMIVVIFSLFYVIGILFMLSALNFWENSMIKTSVYWFAFTALAILFNYINQKEGKNYFKYLLIQNFKLTLLIEFIVNIHQFSFWSEFIFLAIIGGLSIIMIISKSDPQLIKVSNTISFLFIITGIGLLVLSIIDISKSFSDYANLDELKDFLLPIILSICFIPNAFIFALYVEYESLFTNYKIYIDTRS